MWSDTDAFYKSGSVGAVEMSAEDADVPEIDVESSAAKRANVNKEHIPSSPQTRSQRHRAGAAAGTVCVFISAVTVYVYISVSMKKCLPGSASLVGFHYYHDRV